MSPFNARLQEALGTAYQIERELPLGGLGRIFLATEIASGRLVSVQALPPDLAGRVDLGRFRAAVDKVARLKHPGLLPLIAAGARDDIVYCVWPHPRGESLRYRLIRDGGLGADETVQVLHDVADALAYGHGHGVYHGDLRPDNIYLENGRAFIAEFGIRSALNAALGSESGMDARADVHALAVAGQQMVAGRAGPSSVVVARALSIDPGEQFADAAGFRDAMGAPPSSMRRRRRWRLAAAGALLAILGLVVLVQMRGHGVLDSNLLAVVPFDVVGAEPDSLWREGIVTVMSANLDGAGPLHTVSPSVVIRRWKGHADAPSAAALARGAGAKLALFGRIMRAGRDSMRLTATLLDADAGEPIAEMTVADSRPDRLADSLTVAVLRELGRSRPISAVRTASLGAGSVLALKAFLVGEQHYRRSEWDLALDSYRHAIEMDSTFALALYRAGLAVGWLNSNSDSISNDYLTRAAAHNHGLPPRDSMLVVAESLSAALSDGPDQPAYWALYRRLYSTTADAARRYPRDPEVWYEFGDVRYHFPVFTTEQATREAFDHSIALDSAFAPAYIHPIEVASQLGDRAGAQRYVNGYLALHPKDVYADAVRLIGRLLDARENRSAAVQSVLDTASNDLLMATIVAFDGWADSLETSVRLARLMGPSRRGANTTPRSLQIELGSVLAYHGRLREAWQKAKSVTFVAATSAWMGGIPADSAGPEFRRALMSDSLYPRNLAAIGAPWFAEHHDSTSLRELVRRADALQHTTKHPLERLFASYVGQGARALDALVRGDTASAIRGLAALPDTGCSRCVLYTIELAKLLDAKARNDDGTLLLANDSPGREYPTDGFWELFRARLATRQGDRRAATVAYRYVRDVWAHGDDALQPFVKEARDALQHASERD